VYNSCVFQSEVGVSGTAATTAAAVVKKEPVVVNSQWYDVGVVKTTNMLVTHYFVPSENGTQSNGESAAAAAVSFLAAFLSFGT